MLRGVLLWVSATVLSVALVYQTYVMYFTPSPTAPLNVLARMQVESSAAMSARRAAEAPMRRKYAVGFGVWLEVLVRREKLIQCLSLLDQQQPQTQSHLQSQQQQPQSQQQPQEQQQQPVRGQSEGEALGTQEHRNGSLVEEVIALLKAPAAELPEVHADGEHPFGYGEEVELDQEGVDIEEELHAERYLPILPTGSSSPDLESLKFYIFAFTFKL